MQFDIALGIFEVMSPTGEVEWINPRYKHTAVFAEWRNDIIYFGGHYEHLLIIRLRDTVAFNVETKTWTRLFSKGVAPFGREEHCATLLGRQMFVFGGVDAPFRIGDLSQKRCVTWSLPRVAEFAPGPSRTFTLNAFHGQIVLFGDGRHGGEDLAMSLFCPLTSEWKRVTDEDNQGKKPGSDVLDVCGVSVRDGVAYVTNRGIFKAEFHEIPTRVGAKT